MGAPSEWNAPLSHGSGQILQSADVMGTEAAFRSAMTLSEVAAPTSAPMIRAFSFLAVAEIVISEVAKRVCGVQQTHKHRPFESIFVPTAAND